MKMLGALVLVLSALLIALPAHANHGEQKAWSLGEILELGSRALTEAVQRGVEEIEDHIEINADTLPRSEDGNTSTQLRLRLFPKGKDHPEEQMGADTQFQYSLDPQHPHFNFDLKLLPRQTADEYI